jgi:ankyrin repeat protein
MVEILSTLAMGSAQHSASIVDQVLADGKTALHRASERNHYQVADALLELSANYHTVDADGNTALGIARVRDGLNPQPLTISRLLQNKGAYVFSQKLKVVPQPTSSEPTPSPRNLP